MSAPLPAALHRWWAWWTVWAPNEFPRWGQMLWWALIVYIVTGKFLWEAL